MSCECPPVVDGVAPCDGSIAWIDHANVDAGETSVDDGDATQRANGRT